MITKLQLKAPPITKIEEWPGVLILRGDLIHPIVSGNKAFKLLSLVNTIQQNNIQTLVSVGGRYSNHLHALAWFGRELGVATVGYVRGFAEQSLTSTLQDCLTWGMSLHFVSHKDYQRRYENEFWQPKLEKENRPLRINEGAWSKDAIAGSERWAKFLPDDTEVVVCPVGSGTTLAGIVNATAPEVRVIGVPVYADPSGYKDLRERLFETGLSPERYELWMDAHCGGFGKVTSELQQFASRFLARTGIELDRIYTLKTFCALQNKLRSNPEFGKQKIVVLHTGGQQGNRP